MVFAIRIPSGSEMVYRGDFILESESLFDYSDPGKLFYWTKRGNSSARCHPAAQLIPTASANGAADPLKRTVRGGRPAVSSARGFAGVKP